MNRRELIRMAAAAAFYPLYGGATRAWPQVNQTVDDSPEQHAVDMMPDYKPREAVHGVLRLWGHGAPKLDFMGKLAHAWEDEFTRLQPKARFEYDMYGTASAMGALYTRAGDVAVLGQEIYGFEERTFQRVLHHPPFQVNVATGSCDVRNFDFAIVVYVHRSNSLNHLTLDQLSQIFAWQPDARANITRWGQLGLTGVMQDRPINLYGWRSDDVFSTFLQSKVLHGNHKWRCSVQEFAHIHRPDGTVYDSGQQILDRLADDPYGMAFSNYRYAGPEVKPFAIGWNAGGPYWIATKQTLIDQKYPLGRMIPAVADRKPGRPLVPLVREFLLYLLSKQGQQQIVSDGRYLPLSPDAAAAARARVM